MSGLWAGSRKHTLVVVAALALASTSLPAASWLSIAPEQPHAGDEITIRLMSGEPFSGDVLAVEERRPASFQHLWKNGRTHLKSAQDTVAEGPHLISYSSKPATSGGGPRVTHYCKLMFVVGDGAMGPLRYSELGHRLELIPQTDPARLQPGERFEIQLLYDREPLYGAKVFAYSEKAPANTVQSTTDEIGLARLRLQQPGNWIIRVIHVAGGEQMSSTLAFSLSQPGTGE